MSSICHQRSFLSLPPEIRRRIYGFCTPMSGYIQEFIGLLSTCRQVNAEYEDAAISAMHELIGHVEKVWPHSAAIQLNYPFLLSSMRIMSVALPMSLYYPPVGANLGDRDYHELHNTKLEACLAPLFRLSVMLLTVRFYDDLPKDVQSDPEYAPQGLLKDIGNLLVEPPMPAREMPSQTFSTNLAFKLGQPLRLGTICYEWPRPDGQMGDMEWTRRRNRHVKFLCDQRDLWDAKDVKRLVVESGYDSCDQMWFMIDPEHSM